MTRYTCVMVYGHPRAPHALTIPSLRAPKMRPLALEVCENWSRWIGEPDPTLADVFLIGAESRSAWYGSPGPARDVWGAACTEEFHVPFLEATGDPRLSIRAWTAACLVHFDTTLAIRSLAQALAGANFDELPLIPCYGYSGPLAELFENMKRRPGMYLGSDRGRSFYAWLCGFVRGGDWLGLRPVPEFVEWLDALERMSTVSYGSPFAAFRCNGADLCFRWWTPTEGAEDMRVAGWGDCYRDEEVEND